MLRFALGFTMFGLILCSWLIGDMIMEQMIAGYIANATVLGCSFAGVALGVGISAALKTF